MSEIESMSAAAADPKKAFTACYRAFATALRATFPELDRPIKSAELQILAGMHIAKFWVIFGSIGNRVVERDTTLFTDPEFEVLPGVSLNTVWTETSDSTRDAIWKYMINLYKLCELIRTKTGRIEVEADSDEEEESGFASLLGMGADLTKLQGVFTSVAKAAEAAVAGKDASGAEAAFAIPDELKSCSLFKLVTELMSDMSPADLGLNPDEVTTMTPEQVLARIIELHEKEPDRVWGLIRKIGGRLQTKIQTGAITQNSLTEDSKKFIAFMESNETLRKIAEPLKEIFESLSKQFEKATGRGAKGRPGGVTGATTVRDRLRRKHEEKQKAAQKDAQKDAQKEQDESKESK